jgi:hypothetical protein
MLRAFIEIWAGFSPWIRFGTAALILLAGVGFWLVGNAKSAITTWCTGGVLLIFSFPSDAEKRGYHDF